MKTIKLHFCDHGASFKPQGSPFMKVLEKHFDVVLTNDNPDYVICSVFNDRKHRYGGHPSAEHFLYEDAVKIMYSGENTLPDMNFCDYGVGFDHLTFGDRYLRMPIFAFYDAYQSLFAPRPELSADDLQAKTEFCNFTFSNYRAMPARDDFFRRLSAQKHVVSTGRHLRNCDALDELQKAKGLQGPEAKVELLKSFKFGIAFENSLHPGYTTEKLMEPLAARTVPIYFGNPLAHLDFNPEAFINAANYPDLDALVQEVLRIDADDEAYLKMLNADPLPASERGDDNLANRFEEFLCRIFDQPKEDAKRRAQHGQIGIRHKKQAKFSRIARQWWRFR